MWPYMADAGGGTFVLDDGGTLRIVKPGEEDAGYGIYRAADIEVNGVRRRGDVLSAAIPSRAGSTGTVCCRRLCSGRCCMSFPPPQHRCTMRAVNAFRSWSYPFRSGCGMRWLP
ncbi:MAG: hypothetical protein ACLUZZ_05400 [Alistipes inops]